METLSAMVEFRSFLRSGRKSSFSSHMPKPENMGAFITQRDVCINRAIFFGLLQIKCSHKLGRGILEVGFTL